MNMLEIGTKFQYSWCEDGELDEDGYPEDIEIEAEMTVCGYVYYNQELYYTCLSEYGEKDVVSYAAHREAGLTNEIFLKPVGSRVRCYWKNHDKTDYAHYLGTVCGSVRYEDNWFNVVLLDDGREIDIRICTVLEQAA